MIRCSGRVTTQGMAFALMAAALGLAVSASREAAAQELIRTRAVGGISIDPEGMLDNARVGDLKALSRLHKQSMGNPSPDLSTATELRKVSLRKLQAAIERCARQNKPLPEEIRFLAGLQRIEYVFVDLENHDVVLAGPAEGWKADERGFVVGRTTGRPVLLLDDLLVALRAARQPEQGIRCSIDPTAEGLVRLRAHVAGLNTIGNRKRTAAGIEKALGPQRITVEGVPGSSHFARVLVAADYRMKRIAMALDPSPVRALPSFLSMVGAGPRGMGSMLPRWWLEPSYEAIVRDEDGTAWELRGASVRTLTEHDHLAASGQVQRTGQADATAQKWADAMTAAYPQLAVADPVFGQLQNCMDLSLVATLIVRQGLAERAGCGLTTLLDPDAVAVEALHAPRQVASLASLARKGSNWVITASGGVLITPRKALQRVRVEAELKARRIEAAVGRHDDWWWN